MKQNKWDKFFEELKHVDTSDFLSDNFKSIDNLSIFPRIKYILKKFVSIIYIVKNFKTKK